MLVNATLPSSVLLNSCQVDLVSSQHYHRRTQKLLTVYKVIQVRIHSRVDIRINHPEKSLNLQPTTLTSTIGSAGPTGTAVHPSPSLAFQKTRRLISSRVRSTAIVVTVNSIYFLLYCTHMFYHLIFSELSYKNWTTQ